VEAPPLKRRSVRWSVNDRSVSEGALARSAVKELLVGAAQQFLRDQAAFPPFGAAMGRDGKLALVATHLHAQSGVTPRQHFDTLIQGFTAQRNSLRAFGICSEVNLPPSCPSESTGAIQLNIESSDGAAEVFLQPFAIDTSLRFLEGVSEPSVALVFRPRRRWWWPWPAN
jgi:hypothetical protein